jgi:hypothetical protein
MPSNQTKHRHVSGMSDETLILMNTYYVLRTLIFVDDLFVPVSDVSVQMVVISRAY